MNIKNLKLTTHRQPPKSPKAGDFLSCKFGKLLINEKIFKISSSKLPSPFWRRVGDEAFDRFYYNTYIELRLVNTMIELAVADGKSYQPFGHDSQLTWGSYRGDRIGIFNYNTKEDKGYVDIDWFQYNYSKD